MFGPPPKKPAIMTVPREEIVRLMQQQVDTGRALAPAYTESGDARLVDQAKRMLVNSDAVERSIPPVGAGPFPMSWDEYQQTCQDFAGYMDLEEAKDHLAKKDAERGRQAAGFGDLES